MDTEMTVPNVHVLEVTDTLQEIDAIPVGRLFGHAANVEQRALEKKIRLIRFGLRGRESCRTFILTWTNLRVPLGARVMEYEIEWTQHGLVKAKDAGIIGDYFRLADNGDEQQMLVFVHPPRTSRPD